MVQNNGKQIYIEEVGGIMGTVFSKIIIAKNGLRSFFIDKVDEVRSGEELFNTNFNYLETIPTNGINLALPYLRSKQKEVEFSIEIERKKLNTISPFRVFSKMISKILRQPGNSMHSKNGPNKGFRYSDRHYYSFFYS